MNIDYEYKKIIEYLIKNYNVKPEIREFTSNKNYIKFKHNEFNYTFQIDEPIKVSFAPKDYLIHFSREKKTSGFGYAKVYKNDLSIIDDMLTEYISKVVHND